MNSGSFCFGKNFKYYSSLLLLSGVVTLAYFSPFILGALRGYKPELRFLGDLELAGFPAFIQTGKYFSDFTYFGIDFFTANGSSSLFTRPNFTTYFLPQFILQNFIHVTDNTIAVKLFVFEMWLGGFLAMVFTTLWLNKIIKIRFYLSLFGGALFFSIVGYIYSQISFFYVACSFPPLIYCFSVVLVKKTDIYQKLLLSIPVVMILMAGYLPIALMGLCVAFFASIITCKYVIGESCRYRDLLIVFGIVGIVFGAYFITIINAVSIAPAIPKIPLIESLFFSDLSLTFKGVVALFLASATNDSGEAPHFRLGFPILILIYISFKILFHGKNNWKTNTFILCVIFFFMSILLGMGRYSGFADIFFYSVPGLGGMHIYARYMLISVFFLVFALVLGLSELNSLDRPLVLKYPAILLATLFGVLVLFPHVFVNNQISLPILFVELFISVLVLLVLNLRGNNIVYLTLIPLLVFHQGSFVYMTTNWISLSNTGNTAKDIVNNETRKNGLINYFYANTSKTLIKYIDLTPEIEKHGGVPHNFPWFVHYRADDNRRISSYMGYDQGLAQQLEYAQKFSYFGQHDKKYLVGSGLDYVIYDSKTKTKESYWLSQVIDNKVAEHDIGNGFFVAKVSQSQEFEKNLVYDNGVFRVYSEDANLSVGLFKTNWSSRIEFKLLSDKPSIIQFQMFPHKYWKYLLNGTKVVPVLTPSGLASFELPAGANNFIVRYTNYWNLLFVGLYIFYIVLIFIVLARYVFIFSIKKRGPVLLI